MLRRAWSAIGRLPTWAKGLMGGLLLLWMITVVAISCGGDSAPSPSVTSPPPAPVDDLEGPAQTEEGDSPEDEAGSIPPIGSSQLAEVTRVIDGDTIEVALNGAVRRVRYIGMDTPERVECFFQESTAKNRELVGGKQVHLEKDVSEVDRFDRLLRYIYVGDLFVNAELVRLGYANVFTVPPDVKFSEEFLRLEREARSANWGLWNPEACPSSEGAEAGSGGPIAIGQIHYDAEGNDHENLNDEWVAILNSGPAQAMGGWTLSDEANHVFTFPTDFTLPEGASVRVHSGSGQNSETALYWGSGSAIWNNDGDTATLKDSSGRSVATKSY